ncbi:PEPxxWA-CTERM sorting domain-containing protein [Rhizorhabdus dicambivorans]|nr:PEPxxWA-CTERM sorting domain-containing protein [Rhizorhabdus dicambivorans]
MIGKAVIALAAIAGLAAMPARAAVLVSVNAGGSATANLPGYNFSVANLDNAANGLSTVSFAGSSITGTTTSGFVNIGNANVYGGAGGTGMFGTVNGDPATIQLSQSVNYFGLWGSALDGNNTVALYDGDNLLGSFALQSTLQNAPGFGSAYAGNPFGGGNGGELYAFFNFQSDSAFNRVQLIQNGGGGFEFDNLTVGTSSVPITAPEPATWAMMLVGFGLIGALLRNRARGSTYQAARALTNGPTTPRA